MKNILLVKVHIWPGLEPPDNDFRQQGRSEENQQKEH